MDWPKTTACALVHSACTNGVRGGAKRGSWKRRKSGWRRQSSISNSRTHTTLTACGTQRPLSGGRGICLARLIRIFETHRHTQLCVCVCVHVSRFFGEVNKKTPNIHTHWYIFLHHSMGWFGAEVLEEA